MSQRCDICGTEEARFVCGRCGKRVCLQDFRQGQWLCASCGPSARSEDAEVTSVPSVGLSWIIFASFAMVFVGMILMMIASFSEGRGSGSGGAIVLIGPIPVVLGSGPESTRMILIAAVITVIALVAFLLTRRRMH